MIHLQISNDLNVISAEINSYKQVAGQSIFEIGRRLKYVRDNDLAHGQWEKWCKESVNITSTHAYRYIKVFETFSNRTLTYDLGVDMLYILSTMPEEQREQPHIVPSTGEFKTVYEMTVREMREVKQALKQAEERAEKAEKNLEERPEKIVLREDKFKITQLQTEIDRLKNDSEILRKKVDLNEREANEYKKLKEQIEFLNKEKSDLHRQIESATALSSLVGKIDHFLKTELAPIRYSRVLERMDSEVAQKNLTDILDSVDAWSNEMRQFLPKKNRIYVEVLEHERFN
jgi:hypothetical protein